MKTADDKETLSGYFPCFPCFSAMLRKKIVEKSCDTQCTKGDCDVILIKN